MIKILVDEYYRTPIKISGITLKTSLVFFSLLLIKMLILEPIKEITDLLENPEKFNKI